MVCGLLFGFLGRVLPNQSECPEEGMVDGGGVRLLFLSVSPPRELEWVRVGADAAQRVTLMSSGWGKSVFR